MSKTKILSGNALKIIAAISMLVDHIGYLFFPSVRILRILGRLAFPIFAFLIAEGCRYTRNRLRYFLTMSGFATALQLFYYFYSGSKNMTVIVTFSIAIALIYALYAVKCVLFDSSVRAIHKPLAVCLFLLAVASVYALNVKFKIEYGFNGCMLPVAASLFHMPRDKKSAPFDKMDKLPLHVFTMGAWLLYMSLVRGWVQPWSLLSLPVLLLYSGKRGKANLKYFFYLFYPLHLAALEGIRWLLDALK